MRLSEHTDYSMRVLMYCAVHADRLVTIAELAQYYALSRNHLMKIVANLAHQGLLQTVRGRSGGIRLGKNPAKIRVGDVARATETDFRLVECFDPNIDRCVLSSMCRLHGVLNAGLQAFLRTLDETTLGDLVAPAFAAIKVGSSLQWPRGEFVRIAAPESRRKPGLIGSKRR